jgi:hypothetical protein
MKIIYSIAIAVLFNLAASAQCSVVVSQFTNVTCFGNCDGSASLVTVGVGPFSYLWAPGGQTVQNPNNLCPGTHTVTMTDANSCQSSATVTITEPQDISVNMVSSNATCNGSCNGQAQANVTGGTAPYSYAWNDPQSSINDTANNLCPASYTCTITDFNGCTKFSVVTITQPTAVSAVVTTQNPNCHGNCNGIATANGSGGTGPYTYVWSSGCNTPSCTNMCAGGYLLTVTDANSCTFNDSVFLSEPSQIVPGATATDASCLTCSDGTATCAPSGGTSPYTFMWTPGGQTTQSISGLAPGNYTVCVTDANNCSMCDTVTVLASNGIVENDLAHNFSFYPNPVSSELFITSSTHGKADYAVMDVTGKIITSAEYECAPGMTKEINFANLPDGIYFFRIDMDGQKLTKKIVKM